MKRKRVVSAVAVMVAAGVAPLVTATSASANQSDCISVLAQRHYTIGPKVRAACKQSHLPIGGPSPLCTIALIAIGVKDGDAYDACARA